MEYTDSQPTTAPDTQDNNKSPYPKGYFDSLIRQVEIEYQLAYNHQLPRIQKRLTHLKLYNNQKRDPNAVGDILLFSVFQTVLATLYSDQLAVDFLGREQGDEETGENLTSLADFDYDKMEKNKLDYFWNWDTLFFFRSFVLMEQFDRSKDKQCPVPELIDPVTFLHDPKASSVNGSMNGKGAMRFGGWEISMTKNMMKDESGYFNYSDLKPSDAEIKSLIKEAEDARNDANGMDSMKNRDETDMKDNALYSGLRWYSNWNGKKVCVILADNRKRVIKYTEYDNDRFPIIDRALYPMSNEWDGPSLPDLIEDKQRQRAVAINLSIQAMKAELYPQYIYDEDKVKNKQDLLKFGFNKFIGVTGANGDVTRAVVPMNKAAIRMDMVRYVLDTLKGAAEEASATPQVQQGVQQDERRPLGETNLIVSKSDNRYSLTARIFGWSEAEFWEAWYYLYKKHFKEQIDEKVIRIVGSFNTKWRKLTRENIIGQKDPDIKIESRVVSEAKKARLLQNLNLFGQTIIVDPNALGKLYFMRKMAKYNGLDKDEVAVIYPPTVDELIAQQENDRLDKGEMLSVNPDDDDHVHMQEHSKAAETPAKLAHIRGHIANLMAKRMSPQTFNQTDPTTGQPITPPNGAAPASSAMGGMMPPTSMPTAMTPSGAASPTAPPMTNGQ